MCQLIQIAIVVVAVVVVVVVFAAADAVEVVVAGSVADVGALPSFLVLFELSEFKLVMLAMQDCCRRR